MCVFGILWAITFYTFFVFGRLFAGTVGLTVLSNSVVSDSLRPHEVEPSRLLCPRDPPGKDTGVGFHFLLQSDS